MDAVLLIAQGLLATVFLITGMTKLTQPRAKMAAGPMACAADVTDAHSAPSVCSRSSERSG